MQPIVKLTWVIAGACIALAGGALFYVSYRLIRIQKITITHDARLTPEGRSFFAAHIEQCCPHGQCLPTGIEHPAWTTAMCRLTGPHRGHIVYRLADPCALVNQDVLLANGTYIPSGLMQESIVSPLLHITTDHPLHTEEIEAIPALVELVRVMSSHINMDQYIVTWKHSYQIEIVLPATGSVITCQARTVCNPTQCHELSRVMRHIGPALYDIRSPHTWIVTAKLQVSDTLKGR